MKLSVSLPEEDVEFLDAYAREQHIESRSAVLHRAIRLLRSTGLADDYTDAWLEWSASDEAAAWDSTARDGLGSDASR
jgi:Arc/MetJ-type ribon-helix-helix transcriptional regulator